MNASKEAALEPVLESLRAKLLDLSTRNRLLAFSHRSAGCLRVVDELPDQLFEGLMEGTGFGFAAVPEPSEKELVAYRQADEDAPRAETSLQELPRPKAEIWAQHSGIDVSYELPLDEGAERPARHQDRSIQTLLYPDDLDRRLRKLRTDARTAVEETGSNLLHLAFGFLEWRDPRPGGRSHLAPLLLVPVELDRRVERGGKHGYRLSYTGEDLQANLSLEKKLADEFGLVLPALDEEERPERYIAKLRRVTKDLEGWRVRRSVTLALFQFGKQLLYRDLDPKVWPQGRGLAESALVQQMLLGETRGGAGIAAPPPEPTPEDIDLSLELVDRSDSSQSTALLRALAGESLVIQGPPGTGKSQSITNLIAAALARGRSVLFVSEKLAALEVVRRRLDEVGLGDFVLELHSHKTRRQALVEDLRQRLNAAERLRPPRALRTTEATLRERRQALQSYAQAVRRRFGALDWPISDIFFQAGRLTRRLGAITQTLKVPDDLKATAVTEAERRQALESLGSLAALSEACPEAHLSLHPWAGVSSDQVLGEADRRQVMTAARTWREQRQALETAAAPLRQVLALPAESDLAPLVTLSETRAALHDLLQRLSAARPLARQLREFLGTETLGETGDLCAAAAALRLAEGAPKDALALPKALRLGQGAAYTQGAGETLAQRMEQRRRLERDFAAPLGQSGGSAVLRSLYRTLDAGGLFSWFNGGYRAARRQALALSPSGRPLTKAPLRLLQAAQYLEEEAVLLQEARDLGFPCQDLQALSRAFADLKAYAAWQQAVEASFGRGLSTEADWGRALIDLEPDRLTALAATTQDPAGAALLALEEQLANLDPDLDPWLAYLLKQLPKPQAERLAALEEDAFFALLQRCADLAEELRLASEAEAAFARLVDLNPALWHRAGMSPLNRLDLAISAEARLPEWLEADRLLRWAEAPSLAEVMQALLNGALPAGAAGSAYDYLLFDGLARSAHAAEPALRKVRSGDQDRLRSAYKTADEALMEARALAIAADLARAPVPEGRSGKRVGDFTELRLIQREVSKQKRHIPIRQLMRRAGQALQAMKPCFMMGPQSVAQYLEPGALRFDLVLFDEASQVRPEEAIGALARARQAVIVGDSNQLPPTSFFQRTGESEPDEETPLAAESESILEMAEQRLSQVMLRWHYRSLHPDLIAFSNQRFYAGRLQLFPSASRDAADCGLSFEKIAGGCFHEGRNQVEAEAVAAAAVAHLLGHPTQSLGVVAMNVEQRDLIQELIERKVDAEPALAGLDGDEGRESEPFFVKNLENVQGDERDVIMISMTYGPMEPAGRVMQRFGPINQDNGWRRLNVLFSRAKQRMRVFSSMRASDVTPGESSGRGLVELQAFLAYAESGIIEKAAGPSRRGPDSDFEQAVIEGLEERGFHCQPQIGQAGFFIDIGIIDPDRPERYLAGIECDGANYHSSRSARDRDHLRQAVLERLGWTILRVWSTDWFLDPDRSLERLVSRLEGLKQVDAEPPPEPQLDLPGLMGPEDGLALDEALPEVLSERDARDRLIRLRERIQEEHPDHDRASGLLRKSMLDELLRKRPVNEDEFRQQVRRDLREATNGDDLGRYGPRVFDILERIA